jgi:hypothetical protein
MRALGLWRLLGEERSRRPLLAHVVGGPGRVSTWRRGLAAFGEVFREGPRRIVFLLAEKERGLVDEDSDQPAFEGAFGAESWRVSRGGEAAVFDCFLGFLNAVEDAARDEIQQPAAARELQLEGALPLVAGLAVGFEVAAGHGKVDVLDGSRGRGKEFWGGVGHKHLCTAASLVCVCRCVRLHTRFLHFVNEAVTR